MTIDADSDWVPSACTLPTVERPLRLAEFDEFFAGDVRAVHRVSATRLTLIVASASEQTGRALAARESECCSFFTFGFTVLGETVEMVIEVPEPQVRVLDALADRVGAITREKR